MKYRSFVQFQWIGVVPFVVACLVPAVSWSSVAYVETIRSEGSGGGGRFESVRKTQISGAKARMEETVREEGFIGQPAGIQELKSTVIVRLDGSSPVVERSDQGRKSSRFFRIATALGSELWEDPRVTPRPSMRRLGEMRKIDGRQAEHIRILIPTVLDDSTEANPIEARILCDVWVAPDVHGSDEIKVFQQSFLESTGGVSDFMTLPVLVAAFPQSSRAIMSAILGIPGLPLEWVWTVKRRVAGPEEKTLADDQRLWIEGETEDEQLLTSREHEVEANPMSSMEVGRLTVPDKKQERPGEPAGGSVEENREEELKSDVQPLGFYTLAKLHVQLEKIDTSAIDESAFESRAPGTARP